MFAHVLEISDIDTETRLVFSGGREKHLRQEDDERGRSGESWAQYYLTWLWLIPSQGNGNPKCVWLCS